MVRPTVVCAHSINAKQLLAFNRLIMMDAGIIVEAFNLVSNQTIADQSKAMMEMSTPVTAIWEDILLLPIVGIIDSSRAQDIMDSMLKRAAVQQTRVFILDISGVAVVDTAVASALVEMDIDLTGVTHARTVDDALKMVD
jgi:rsbT co-antagonist protein RsbR